MLRKLRLQGTTWYARPGVQFMRIKNMQLHHIIATCSIHLMPCDEWTKLQSKTIKLRCYINHVHWTRMLPWIFHRLSENIKESRPMGRVYLLWPEIPGTVLNLPAVRRMPLLWVAAVNSLSHQDTVSNSPIKDDIEISFIHLLFYIILWKFDTKLISMSVYFIWHFLFDTKAKKKKKKKKALSLGDIVGTPKFTDFKGSHH